MKIEDALDLKDFNFLDDLFGSCDEKINLIKKKFNVEVFVRQNFLKILGFEKDVVVAKKVILYILDSLKKGETITKQNVEFILNCVEKGQFFVLSGSFKKQICKNFKNKPILTQTVSQKKYSELIDENLIVFGVGPAGTGKTETAMQLVRSLTLNSNPAYVIDAATIITNEGKFSNLLKPIELNKQKGTVQTTLM